MFFICLFYNIFVVTTNNLNSYLIFAFLNSNGIDKNDIQHFTNCQNAKINISCRMACTNDDPHNMCNLKYGPTNASQFLFLLNKSTR